MSPEIKKQAKLVGIALAAGLAWTMFGTGTALAASPQVEACEADGGDYVKDGPEAKCVYPEETVGNAPEDSNAQRTSKTQTGQGNLGNKTQLNCSGPPGQQDPDCP